MARSLSSFDSHLSTVPARGALCPCGSTELDGARLDHEGRAECCEDYCSPESCECASDSAPSSDECHAAWVRLGSQGPIALLDRLVATMTATGVDQYAAEDAAVAVYDAGGVGTLAYAVERAEAKTVVTVQRIYPVTDATMRILEEISEEPVACGCGRSHTRAAFLALPAPVAGDTMDDGDGGVLILRNCPCGSTRAILATSEEMLRACPESSAHVDGWKAEAIAHQELFGIFEELAGAAEAENDGDWEAEARSNYYADLGLAGSMR